MSNKALQGKRTLLIGLAVFLVSLCATGSASEITVSGQITYAIPNAVYVNVGTSQGLEEGIFGTMQFDDGQGIEFDVSRAARQSALLHVRSRIDRDDVIGSMVELSFEPRQVEPIASGPQTEQVDKETSEDRKSTYLPVQATKKEDFVPLLTPARYIPETSGAKNVFHGKIQVRQMLQTDEKDDLSYSITRLNSSGSLDNIMGSGWDFQWSGGLRYRDGEAFRRHREFRDPRVDIYRLVFQRSIGDDGFVRFGRFVPQELPGVGYLDGVQGEMRLSDHVMIGAVAGFRPDRGDLDFSVDEPQVAVYTTVEAGKPGGPYYSGTLGLLGTFFEGHADRMVLLISQRAGLGPRLTLYSTAAVDFDIGGAEFRDGVRLSRLDLYAVSKLTSWLTVRAGFDHWERPDNRAERDLLGLADDRFFDSGFWRYWVGSDQSLPGNLRLSEEVSVIDPTSDESEPRWRVRLTRTGLFSWKNATANVTVFNLIGQNVDGYGGRFSAYLPLFNRKLSIQPAAGFRMLETKRQSEDFTLTYLSLRFDARISKQWTLFGGVTQTRGNSVSSELFDFGLRYTW